MSGKISFHFDDGHMSHYEQAFKVFQEAGVAGCLALSISCFKNNTRITMEQALEMQEKGWEILCHSMNHIRMREPLPAEVMETEIVECKYWLEKEGIRIGAHILGIGDVGNEKFDFLNPQLDEIDPSFPVLNKEIKFENYTLDELKDMAKKCLDLDNFLDNNLTYEDLKKL